MGKYQRIQKLCKEKGVSVAKMERDLNFARGSVAKIDEHKPSAERLSKICMYLGVSPMSLMADEDPVTASELIDEINNSPSVEVPVYEVSAGNGRVSSAPEIQTHEDGEYAVVIGDSMYPTLHNGDVVRIIETSDISPIDVAFVKVNGDENTLKHVEVTDKGVWIRGENPDAFTDRFYTMQEVLTLPVQIVGKAVEIVSRKL